MSPVAELPHIVIRASAGAGKTYQLSNRYLQLMLAGNPPEQILAATFARKAAGEILDRVVSRLAEAAAEPKKLRELAAAVSEPDLNSERCLTLLRTLLGRLHHLQIGTLDSFFMQLARHFGLDMGLPLGWRIVDDLEDSNIRQEAIQQVLADEATSDAVTLMRLLSKGDASRSVTQQILDIVNNLYGVYHDTTKEMWHHANPCSRLDDATLRPAITHLQEMPEFSNGTWKKAHLTAVAAAEREDWLNFIRQGIGCAVALGCDTFASKPIEPDVALAYGPLVKHAKAVVIDRLFQQTEATYRLLSRFDGAYRALKHDRRALRFDDIPRLLASAFAANEVDGLALRLDGRVAHLLLDEFQDTSRDQWKALEPFAQRATEPDCDGSLFCVGDTKQAIYGWRGGVAEIFDSATQSLSGVQEQSLARSFRSSPVVIDTVNRVFDRLRDNEALDEFPSVAAEWGQRFEPHSTAKTELPGYCRLLTAPRAEEKPNQPLVTLDYAAGHVAQLASKHSGRTIGVLVRENWAVAHLIYRLRTNHHLLASEEGGNPLTDSPAVELLLSLLRLADHPGHSTAAFHVATSPLGAPLKFTDHTDRAAAQRLALDIREQLLSHGYGRVIYGWTKLLSPQCDARDLGRLMQLVELAHVLDGGGLRRPDDFILQVESRRVEDPTSAPVRVMTVHQAKGLEFDIVVLPQLDKNLKGQVPQLVIERPDPLGPIGRVCRYASETVQKLLPREMQPMFQSWGEGLVSEQLCVLYVAMTRAIHSLDMIIAPSAENEGKWPKTWAGMLRSALVDSAAAPPETVLFEMPNGGADWDVASNGREKSREVASGGRSSTAATPAVAEPLKLGLRSGKRRRGLDATSPSRLEGTGKIDARLLMRLDSGGSLARGKLVHAWLEQIAWLEDGLPPEAVLRQIAGPLIAGAQAENGLRLDDELTRFWRLVEKPSLSRALSQSLLPALSADASRELRREWRFAHRRGDTIIEGAVDRLVLTRDADRWLSADILDFKTDAVSDANAAKARAEYYRPQVQAYREAVAAIFGLPADRITARLAFVELDLLLSIE